VAAGVHELTVANCYHEALPAMQKIIRFLRSEDGPTAVEYAVMLAMIFMVCIAAITLVGQRASSSFTSSNAAIGNALGS
jgi:pilus assembly protein Flp/PilA